MTPSLLLFQKRSFRVKRLKKALKALQKALRPKIIVPAAAPAVLSPPTLPPSPTLVPSPTSMAASITEVEYLPLPVLPLPDAPAQGTSPTIYIDRCASTVDLCGTSCKTGVLKPSLPSSPLYVIQCRLLPPRSAYSARGASSSARARAGEVSHRRLFPTQLPLDAGRRCLHHEPALTWRISLSMTQVHPP